MNDYAHLLALQVPENIYTKDKEGVYRACSDQFAQLAGFASADELIGKKDIDCSWAASAALFRENDKHVLSSGQTLIYHESTFTQDGQLILMRTTKKPLKTLQGEVIGIVGVSNVLSDLTQTYEELLKQLHEKEHAYNEALQYLINWYAHLSGEQCSPHSSPNEIARKIQHYFNYMINRLPVNVFWFDKSHHALGCNTNLADVCRDLGREGDINNIFRVQYEGLQQFLDDSTIEMLEKNNQEAMNGDEMQIFEEHITTLTGTEQYFLSYKGPIFDENHKKIGLLGVSVDITDRKKMEEDLRKSKERIELAYWSKIQFLRNMRHDVRTPLSCIVASVRIMEKMQMIPEAADFLKGVLNASENLLKILTRMLEHDHGQSDECPIELEAFRIRKVFHDFMDLFMPMVQQRGIDLILDIHENVPDTVVSDFYRFHRIFLNLINNAVKFTHKGSVSLIVTRLGEHHVKYSVIDTGIGIPQDKQEIIFQKFVRLIDSDQGEYQGEGLGLGIVKEFVEDLGGTVTVSSVPKQGSTFTVILPISVTDRLLSTEFRCGVKDA